MVNPFSWIRNRVRDAVVSGFVDGLAVIDQGDSSIDNSVPVALAERLKLTALPAGSEPETETKRRKTSAA